MIIQPNQRRRTRLFRVASGVAVLVFVATLIGSGWSLPTIDFTAAATATAPASAALATPSPARPTPTPTPSAPPPTPAPTPPVIVDGCVVPPAGLEPAIVAFHGPRTGKTVAITFDDGNDPDVVKRVLALLTKKHVNATFFPTGRAVERFPDVWKRVAAAGFPIANHTYHHRALKGECYADQLTELLRDERVIEGVGLTLVPLMRPPFEEYDDATRLASTSAGIERVVLWDVDTLDWTGISWQAIVRRAMVGTSGSIVLMHLSSRSTVWATQRIIARYRARGFTFVTVGTMLGVEGPVPYP